LYQRLDVFRFIANRNNDGKLHEGQVWKSVNSVKLL
jgi:hypothetical protein